VRSAPSFPSATSSSSSFPHPHPHHHHHLHHAFLIPFERVPYHVVGLHFHPRLRLRLRLRFRPRPFVPRQHQSADVFPSLISDSLLAYRSPPYVGSTKGGSPSLIGDAARSTTQRHRRRSAIELSASAPTVNFIQCAVSYGRLPNSDCILYVKSHS
jgi:hypothetical protein